MLDPERICTLPPDALDERRAWIRRELLPHALGREVLGEDAVAFGFRREPELERAVARLVELERACCSAIDFSVEEATDGALRLIVRGVDPSAPILAAP